MLYISNAAGVSFSCGLGDDDRNTCIRIMSVCVGIGVPQGDPFIMLEVAWPSPPPPGGVAAPA
jgi:hypothetical protein